MQQRIEAILDRDVYFIAKELDNSYNCSYSTDSKMQVVKALVKLRKEYPDKSSKLTRIISHFGIEHRDLIRLKPNK
jgi:DNA polymerase III epsilon subunit-like protein